MKNKNLLSKCRYFKGEDSCPSDLMKVPRGYIFWRAEKLWVSKNGKVDRSSFLFMVDCGLSDEHLLLAGKPAEFTKIPLDLRAAMFESLCKGSDLSPQQNAKFFMDVVLPEYLS